MLVDRCGSHAVYYSRIRIHSDVRLHPEMPLIPFLCLVHLRVSPPDRFLVDDGASMMLASTIVPSLSRSPWEPRWALISSSSPLPSSCRSRCKRRRNTTTHDTRETAYFPAHIESLSFEGITGLQVMCALRQLPGRHPPFYSVNGGGKVGHWGLLMFSESVRANWPARMSHDGECDIDAERTDQTSGA